MLDNPSRANLQINPYAEFMCLSPATMSFPIPPGGGVGHSGADWDVSKVAELTDTSFDPSNSVAAMHFFPSDLKEFNRIAFAYPAPSR